MKIKFSLFGIAILFSFHFFISPSIFPQENIWTEKQETEIVLRGERVIIPQAYKTFSLNKNALINLLSQAPMESNSFIPQRTIEIELPMPDGELQKFMFVESPVMAPELAAKYPEIKTYLAKGITDPYAVCRFDYTPQGFHAMILSPNGRVFIDPYSKGDTENYISYYSRDYIKENALFDCEVISDESRQQELNYLKENKLFTPTGPQLRTYRLAVATTGEYSAFHGGTKPLVMAAVVTTVNRVVGVYETDLAVRMVLIPNNDTLIFLNASTDPYTNNNGSTMLGQNQTTIDNYIGNANYDIGHVFSTGGGGVAYLGVVCVAGLKARGVTGSPAPIGDPFDIDYVAHEIGHQFGGNHSFNGNAGACSGGNRNASTAYEPGSGSTIMAYAGICSPQNLQNNSDPYFHVVNFAEIVSYTNFGSGNSCAQITSTGNSAPTVTVPTGGFYIPKSTPFALTGSATDPDGDALTYSWEEFDLGPAGHPNSPSGNAPIFRVFNPVPSPTRTFPKLSSLLSNTQVMGEILPAYARTLTFRLVARDNRPAGGGVNYAQMQFQVDGNSGPFTVTSPNTNVSWPGLSQQTITWNVSNTNIAPVNCTNVNLLLSVDGGQTYPFILTANTPNDGSELVTLPDNPTTTARIKVEAAGNVFFDISNFNFTIENAIPVELVSFTAELIKDGVLLNWITATETNNAGFTIERGTDSENFSEIGFVGGKGTTTEPTAYSYLDKSVQSGTYYYRLKQTDYDGTFKYLNVVQVEVGLPTEFSLEQNYPNPFNPTTVIEFVIPSGANNFVTLKVFDMLGNEVVTLVNEYREAGVYKIEFDASNIPSGMYVYKLSAGSFSASKKMVLIK
ncbi:reprolysin-like metallopeptidase [Ignavibacterium sp.]|uniref:reprolysin-like metallopeptidase n=1 Tax=Ignavibacterium sp. TaxID=2651167 RepID=UPI00307F5E85